MKFGFFLKGKLVDSCHAETASEAKTGVVHDGVHPIIDADQLIGGTLNSDNFTASGTKEMPFFNVKLK